jgi:integrative and conjugative element protein (TIGR02256 family)
MPPPVFVRGNGGLVAFSDQAISVFGQYVQRRARDREAGGVLLGRRVIQSNDVVIDEATEPAPDDSRARFRFFRRAEPAQKAVDRVWANSDGTVNYLGEWHSHPEDVPTPSGLDLSSWRETLVQARFEQDFLLFVIVGRTATKVWELSSDGSLVALSTR